MPPPPPKPDWSKWGLYVEARLAYAVALSIDIDPEYAVLRDNQKPVEYYNRFDVAANQGRAGRFEIFTRGDRQDFVDLAEFRAWAIGLGWSLPREFPNPNATSPARAHSEHGHWPWGAYETPHLKAFAEAGKEFFGKPIPRGSEPKSESIVEFLMDMDVPKHMAEMMARILRDPKTPAGPRRDPSPKTK